MAEGGRDTAGKRRHWGGPALLVLGALLLVASGDASGAPAAETPSAAPAGAATVAPAPATGGAVTTEAPAPILPATGAPTVPAPTPGLELTVPPSATLPAAPEVQVVTEFYTDTYRVIANSCQTASDYMRAHGPGGWPAETQLLFEFHTPPVTLRFVPNDSGGGVCTRTRLDVPQTVLTFTLHITLPEWEAQEQTGCAGAAREWDNVRSALVLHEHGHADRYQARFNEWAAKVSGRLAAAQIVACAATPAEATAEAQRQIDAVVRGISDQLQSEITDDPEQQRYEQETQHGINQGAVFHEDACGCGP